MKPNSRYEGDLVYHTGVCLHGGVLLAATAAAGLAYVGWDDDEDKVISGFFAHFGYLDINNFYRYRAPYLLKKRNKLAAVAAVLVQPKQAYAETLDVYGSAFQLRVWAAIRQIPCGRTWTYAKLAEKIGAPKAYRAVAQACGANPLPIVIPCHRVVASHDLGGYRLGVTRKQILLNQEHTSKVTSE